MWRWVIVGVVVIGVVGGFLWFRNRGDRNTGQEVLRTAEVVRDDLEITVSASGNIIANRKVDLNFDSRAEVVAINVEVGEYAEEGDVLARLDTTDLERAVTQAEVSLAQVELRKEQLEEPTDEEDLRRAQNQVNQAANNLQVAQLNQTQVLSSSLLNEDLQSARDRFNDLETQYGMRQMEFEQGEVSDWTRDRARERAENAYWEMIRLEQQAQLEQERAQNEVTQAWNAYQEARDRLETLEKNADPLEIESRNLDIRAAELSLERAQDNLEAALLTAPFDGLVADVNLQAGVQAPTTLPALTLVDDTLFFVEVTVDETDIGKLEIGQAVEVIVDAYPGETLAGTVVTIAPAPATTGGNVGIVSYPVRIRLEPAEEVQVRDGMTASVLIRTRRLEDVLLVPNWAVRTDQDSQGTYTYCYCVEAGQPVRREVTIGARNEQFTQILDGLEAGDVVALVTEERSNLFELGGGPPSRN
ncbi:MAG: HlyD family secretion protein [Anaerolineales bacterium]